MENQVPEVVNALMQAAIDVLAWAVPIIITVVIPRAVVFVKREFERIVREQPEWTQELIENAAFIGASFAEKIDAAGLLEEYANTKKEAALQAADRWLREQGYSIDTKVLDEAIEVVLFNNPEIFG